MRVFSGERSFWYHQRHDESQSQKGSKKSDSDANMLQELYLLEKLLLCVHGSVLTLHMLFVQQS